MAKVATTVLLVFGLVVSGTLNTLLIKFQDKQCIANCEHIELKKRELFRQPIWQTLNLFLGESGCWLIIAFLSVTRYRNQPSYRLIIEDTAAADDNTDASVKEKVTICPGALYLALPAICDICATSLMNLGLLGVPASVFQMARSSLVVFVGLFSTTFLRKKLYAFQWFAIAAVVLGVAVVGLSNTLFGTSLILDGTNHGRMQAAWGAALIVLGQSFVAAQFVLEEYIFEHYSMEPVHMVAWEGLFGTIIVTIGMLSLWVTVGESHGILDVVDAWQSVSSSIALLLTSAALMISIGLFAFTGICVTKSVSATARSIFDIMRTLLIWIISLALGWESFNILQSLGFAFLVWGAFIFNRVLEYPSIFTYPSPYKTILLPEEPAEHF